MKANDQCNRCGIDRDVHDLRPAPDHAFVEHRAELLKLQDDLLQGANREVAMEATIERLGKDGAVLATENERLKVDLSIERRAYDETLYRLKAELAECEAALQLGCEGIQAYCDSENAMRDELAEAKNIAKECRDMMIMQMKRESGEFHLSAEAFAPMWGAAITAATKFLAAPPPAESTPVQVPIYEDGKRMDGPAATLSLKNPAAINRTTPGTTTCELCMQNDADRPAAFQCDGCAEYSCIEHAAAHRCLTTPAAPPDDIRAFTPPLTAREWMMDHERRLAALEAKGAAPMCYSVDCRYYGQRHVTAHEPREDQTKGAKP